jgi:predicted ArsR family transcriptional regulator
MMLSLFDELVDGYGPNVRATDPDTAQVAADSVHALLPGQRSRVLVEVARSGYFGATAYDVAVAVGNQQSVMSKRLSELHAVGLVDKAEYTRTGVTGRQLTVYLVNDRGRDLVARIEEAQQ